MEFMTPYASFVVVGVANISYSKEWTREKADVSAFWMLAKPAIRYVLYISPLSSGISSKSLLTFRVYIYIEAQDRRRV